MSMRCLRSLAVFAMVLALGLMDHGASATAAERIYVLSQTGATLSEIEDGAEATSGAIALDKAPAALAIAPDGSRAYVTHPDLGAVSIVDLAKKSVLRTLKVGGSPFGVAIARDGRLFVADWNGSHVSVLDADGNAPAKTVEVGRAPAHLLLSPDEKLLFVANRESDSVSVIRTDDLTAAATVPVGRAPFAIALSPDARSLYVGNVQGGTVSRIDTTTFKVADVMQSGAMPYGAAVTNDGQSVLVTNQQSGTIAVLGTAGAPPAHVKVGSYPEGIVIVAGGARCYVANWFSDTVSVVDLVSLKEIRRIKVPGGPRGLAVLHESPERPSP